MSRWYGCSPRVTEYVSTLTTQMNSSTLRQHVLQLYGVNTAVVNIRPLKCADSLATSAHAPPLCAYSALHDAMLAPGRNAMGRVVLQLALQPPAPCSPACCRATVRQLATGTASTRPPGRALVASALSNPWESIRRAAPAPHARAPARCHNSRAHTTAPYTRHSYPQTLGTHDAQAGAHTRLAVTHTRPPRCSQPQLRPPGTPSLVGAGCRQPAVSRAVSHAARGGESSRRACASSRAHVSKSREHGAQP